MAEGRDLSTTFIVQLNAAKGEDEVNLVLHCWRLRAISCSDSPAPATAKQFNSVLGKLNSSEVTKIPAGEIFPLYQYCYGSGPPPHASCVIVRALHRYPPEIFSVLLGEADPNWRLRLERSLSSATQTPGGLKDLWRRYLNRQMSATGPRPVPLDSLPLEVAKQVEAHLHKALTGMKTEMDLYLTNDKVPQNIRTLLGENFQAVMDDLAGRPPPGRQWFTPAIDRTSGAISLVPTEKARRQALERSIYQGAFWVHGDYNAFGRNQPLEAAFENEDVLRSFLLFGEVAPRKSLRETIHNSALGASGDFEALATLWASASAQVAKLGGSQIVRVMGRNAVNHFRDEAVGAAGTLLLGNQKSPPALLVPSEPSHANPQISGGIYVPPDLLALVKLAAPAPRPGLPEGARPEFLQALFRSTGGSQRYTALRGRILTPGTSASEFRLVARDLFALLRASGVGLGDVTLLPRSGDFEGLDTDRAREFVSLFDLFAFTERTVPGALAPAVDRRARVALSGLRNGDAGSEAFRTSLDELFSIGREHRIPFAEISGIAAVIRPASAPVAEELRARYRAEGLLADLAGGPQGIASLGDPAKRNEIAGYVAHLHTDRGRRNPEATLELLVASIGARDTIRLIRSPDLFPFGEDEAARLELFAKSRGRHSSVAAAEQSPPVAPIPPDPADSETKAPEVAPRPPPACASRPRAPTQLRVRFSGSPVGIYVDGSYKSPAGREQTLISPPLNPCGVFSYELSVPYRVRGRQAWWNYRVSVEPGKTTEVDVLGAGNIRIATAR